MRKPWLGSAGAPGAAVAGLLAVVLALWGCEGGGSSAPSAPGLDTPRPMRIVCFVPSATQIVIDLGLGAALVGVAEHDAPAQRLDAELPVVGNFQAIDYERLLALRPTHVIFPETARAAPQRLREAAALAGFVLHVEPYPHRLDEALAAVRRVGEALGQPDASLVLASSMRAALDQRPARMTAGTEPPRVLLVFAVDPVVASGPGSVNDELLARLGARNAVADAAVSAVTLDRELLVANSPDVVVLLLPAATDEAAEAKVAWFDGLPIPAVQRGRVVALTDPLVLLPSTNLPAVLAALEAAVWGGQGLRGRDAGAGVGLE